MSEPYVPYRSASERMREEVDALLEEEGEEEPSSQVSELADDIAGLFDVDADETAVSADVTLRVALQTSLVRQMLEESP